MRKTNKRRWAATTYVVEDEDAFENDYVRAIHRRRLLEPAHIGMWLSVVCYAWNVCGVERTWNV
jgi:hypothetical protein